MIFFFLELANTVSANPNTTSKERKRTNRRVTRNESRYHSGKLTYIMEFKHFLKFRKTNLETLANAHILLNRQGFGA